MRLLDKLFPKIQRRNDGEGQGRRNGGWGTSLGAKRGSAGQAEEGQGQQSDILGVTQCGVTQCGVTLPEPWEQAVEGMSQP